MWLATQTRPDISNAVRAVAILFGSQVCALEGSNGYLKICETDERTWYYFSGRHSRRFELAGVC